MRHDYFPKILSILRELKKKYPTYEVGRHISSATVDYTDIWGISDKELYFALSKYKEDLLLNGLEPSDEDLSKIIQDGMDLDTLLEEEDY